MYISHIPVYGHLTAELQTQIQPKAVTTNNNKSNELKENTYKYYRSNTDYSTKKIIYKTKLTQISNPPTYF